MTRAFADRGQVAATAAGTPQPRQQDARDAVPDA
jgi:hypothetical protein